MKDIVYLVFLAIFCATGLADDNPGYQGEDYYEEYVDNPDNYDEIVRPCQVYDINCIRRFFAEHSKCQIRNGPIPDAVTIPQTLYLGRINTSLVLNNNRISGLNSTRIEEFYYNKATNKIVFAIEITNFARNSANNYFVVYRRGREPVTAVATGTFLLTSLTATSVIPFYNDIKLENAEITAYFDNPTPLFSFGPELINNPDPAIASALVAQVADLRTDTQEDFLTAILPLPIFYIQTNICDFGLKLPETAGSYEYLHKS